MDTKALSSLFEINKGGVGFLGPNGAGNLPL